MDKIVRLFYVVFIALSLFSRFFVYYSDSSLHIYFLDVGQGDAILIQTPDHKFVLIDGGPDSKVLSELGEVLPFWVRKLDLVLLTHPDADHLTGLTDVLATYNVEAVMTTSITKETGIFKVFVRLIEEENIENRFVNSSSDFTFGCCVHFDFLWPMAATNLDEVEPINNTSIVISLSYGDFKAFLAGDIESAIEQKLVKLYDLDANFLKVSHHGSKTSSTEDFLEDIDADVAFISVGKDNKFDHPKQEVLERLNLHNIQVFRTDVAGRIELTIKENTYNVDCEKTCNGP